VNKKITDVVSYLTWVGLVIALVAGDRYASRFHMNQSLAIWMTSTLAGIAIKLVGWIPVVGWILRIALGVVEIFCAVCWFIGIIGALQGTEKPVPVLGQVQLL